MKTRRASAITMTVPFPNVLIEWADQTKKITTNLLGVPRESFSRLKQKLSGTLARERIVGRQPGFKSRLPLVLLIAIIAVVLTVSVGAVRNAMSADMRVEITPAKAVMAINKELSFPLRNEKGETVVNITYTIESAELRDEIVVKGQRASSVKGRTFLIIPIKITNNFDKSIEIQTKDYVRLTVNGNDKEQLAADVHNDPVVIQAISTKYTRLGFPINDTDKNIVLHVGELNGEKESINLTF